MRIRPFVAAVAVFPSLVRAAEPIHLAPSSPWAVDYAQNSCRLVRHFGQGSDATILALESQAPGALDMMIVSKRAETMDEQAWARFVPMQTKLIEGIGGRATEKSSEPVLLFPNVSLLTDDETAAEKKTEKEQEAHPNVRPAAVSLNERAARRDARQSFASSTTAIEFYAGRNRPVILDAGSLGEPIKAFDECSRDSLRDWGVDPDVEDKIVRPAWAPKPAAWFSAADYPQKMIRNLEESVVKVRVLVDATGRVTKCTSLSHFNEPEFDKITCDRFTSRAHFEPAELADGTKVPSYYVNTVIFRIAQ